jgi:hypothetical protein
MRVQKVETRAEHMSLLAARDVQEAIARFLERPR